MGRRINVLIVDDSPVVRQVMRRELSKSKEIGTVLTASNGSLALKKVKQNPVDVMTLDVEMPGMDGLDTLRAMSGVVNIQIIMLSAYTFKGAEKTIKALELGAVDFIQKPGGRLSSDVAVVAQDLTSRICAVAKQCSDEPSGQPDAQLPHDKVDYSTESSKDHVNGIVAIGASTGGTEALRHIIARLPQSFPAGIVVVQHMPEGFTRAFAKRMNELSELEVKEAGHRDMLGPGRVLIAPGHSHITVQKSDYGHYVETRRTHPVNGHMPSVDVLFDSVSQLGDTAVVAALLTGMGRDGAEGLLRIRENGGYTIAQNETSSVVYGMPRAAAELGAAMKILPLSAIADEFIGGLRDAAFRKASHSSVQQKTAGNMPRVEEGIDYDKNFAC